MKVIIAGSRDITDFFFLDRFIKDSLNVEDITEIVSGKAKGVDRLGEIWAYKNGIPVKEFPANWMKYGKKAGIMRNHLMAEYADALVAIWDGKSVGTQNMINKMMYLNKPVYWVIYVE